MRSGFTAVTLAKTVADHRFELPLERPRFVRYPISMDLLPARRDPANEIDFTDVNDVQVRAKLSHERRCVTQRPVRFVRKIGWHENSADVRQFLRGGSKSFSHARFYSR